MWFFEGGQVKLHFISWALAMSSLCSAAVASEMVVIVSAKRPAMVLSANQVTDIFLAQAERFPNGDNATPLDLALSSPLREHFYARVAAKSPVLLRAYWTKMVFTGRGLPPREMASSLAMRKLVAADPTMIGYIDSAALDDSVQVVLTVAR